MNESAEIRKAIRDLAAQGEEVYSVVGKVESVDETKRTCTVQPYDDSAMIHGVRLQSYLNGKLGICPLPAQGSAVVVTFLNKQTGYVAVCGELEKLLTDCDEIIVNGGGNEGMVLVIELTKKLNKLEDRYNSLLSAFQKHVHVDPLSGTTGPITPPHIKPPLIKTNKSEIQNTKIKH